MDLGCNSGADLDILRRHGWSRLAGIDIGHEALSLFRQRFPETWATSEVIEGLFETSLPTLPDASIENVISNGATLELVHPAYGIEAHLARVARNRIILDICESGHTYPRDYVAIFASLGFDLIYWRRPDDRVNEASLLHFERRTTASPDGR